MFDMVLQNLGVAFSKFMREPTLIGAAVAFLVSGAGNVYQFIDKQNEL